MISRAQMSKYPFWHETVMGFLLLIFLAAMGMAEPAFISWQSQRELSTHIWELALLAIPMTLIIITSGIDLSIGSAMALAAVALGLCFEAGMSPWTASLIAIIAGGLAGALNGVFVAWIRVHPLIV
ncbi:hypothetical protein JW926_15495, partial [Candidatus Sumerlaeota bacterium]|nr:hypothetical protein [Candidatus Sumerlaeota bacterium]